MDHNNRNHWLGLNSSVGGLFPFEGKIFPTPCWFPRLHSKADLYLCSRSMATLCQLALATDHTGLSIFYLPQEIDFFVPSPMIEVK